MNDPDRPAGGDPSPTMAGRVDEACDRFEAAWKAGRRPRIEDHLGDVPEPDRPHLFGELLTLDLAYRCRGGVAPGPEEYRARFPGLVGLVDAAFAGLAAQPPTPPRPRAAAGGERDLLFGLLALQVGLIDQAQLVAAFHAWTRDKARPLADHFRALGYLDDEQRGLVEALAAQHLKKHGGDAEKSLAAVGVEPSIRRSLAAAADPEINSTLVGLVFDADGDADPDRTASYAVGAATGSGQRFRVLRPHAQGGLGAVFVARDEELHREVALKQILDRHADDTHSRARFLVEAEITGKLEHPGVIPVYGLGHDPSGRPYYAMRLVKGESLKEAVARFHRAEGPGRDRRERALALRRLLGRFIAVCNTIAYAHSRGVIHRDLKPGNVLLGPFGETLVIDWGLAKVVGRPESARDVAEATLRPALAERGGRDAARRDGRHAGLHEPGAGGRAPRR